jgi:hypothetical protein
MARGWQFGDHSDERTAKERVRAVVERQGGRISRAQLEWIGVREGTIASWLRSGRLVKVLPGVYGLGHAAPADEAGMWAALLFAGPGAALCDELGAWWRGLIDDRPRIVQITTPRRVVPREEFVIHSRRPLDRFWHRGMPVTSVAQTMRDLAAGSGLTLVRRALARLDFRGQFDADGLLAICQPGAPGSAALRWAVENYDPRFGKTFSVLEDNWLWVCERLDIPKPDEINEFVFGIRCDAHYVEQGLVIEFDGNANHRTPAQIRRDRRNELTLRRFGRQVNRYSFEQVESDPMAVRGDVLTTLEQRAGLFSSPPRRSAPPADQRQARRPPR